MINKRADILVCDNSYKLTDYLSLFWVRYARDVINKNGRFTAALSGGRTPVEFYCKLSNIDDFSIWSKTSIFMTDERMVPKDHKDSNGRMIEQNLVNYLFLEPRQFLRISTNFNSAQEAAENYAIKLKSSLNLRLDQLPRLDLIVLGVGKDGHIASLFSEGDLRAPNKQLVITSSPKDFSHTRISLSLPVINNAKKIICIVTGKEKKNVIDLVINGGADLPASRLNPSDGQLIFLLDKESSGDIKGSRQYNNEEDFISLLI